jgi:hypothetical protein
MSDEPFNTDVPHPMMILFIDKGDKRFYIDFNCPSKVLGSSQGLVERNELERRSNGLQPIVIPTNT